MNIKRNICTYSVVIIEDSTTSFGVRAVVKLGVAQDILFEIELVARGRNFFSVLLPINNGLVISGVVLHSGIC